MIMHTFADWGNTGQNMAESLGITTVSTTKAHGRNWDKGKGMGRNPVSYTHLDVYKRQNVIRIK